MRILGFSKKWDKLHHIEFTTFRFPRRDKDWEVGEQVQVVYKPRSKEREILGIARINFKEIKQVRDITEDEAVADGFLNTIAMRAWLGKPLVSRKIHKLSLRWLIR